MAIAAEVGTRDKRGVASHAQKIFIRWAADGRRLPAAVEAMGGPGYTLSGKLLDPHCASARAYGLRPERVADLLAAGADLPGVLAPDDPACEVFQPGREGWTYGGGATPAKAKKKAAAKKAAAARPPPPPPPPPRAPSPSPSRSPTPPPPAPPAPRTEYAASRPRRAAAGPGKAALGATTEALDLLPCRPFLGPPGSAGPHAQPYALSVGRAALAVMDLHAHLCSKEVIGLLGGAWDPAGRALVVAAAFPCGRAPGSLSGTSCELDPASEVASRAAMASAGLVPVGWYHSHPVFEATPSVKDTHNQRNYQALFATAATASASGGGAAGGGTTGGAPAAAAEGAEPFVGAIVGPYDPALPSPASQLTWFIVGKGGGGGGGCGGGSGHGHGGCAPFSLRHSLGPRAEAGAPAAPGAAAGAPSSSAPPPTLADDLLALARSCVAEPDAVGLGGRWRGFTARTAGGAGGEEGPPLTKGQKAFASLARHLAPGPAVGRLVASLARELGVDPEVAAEAAGLKKKAAAPPAPVPAATAATVTAPPPSGGGAADAGPEAGEVASSPVRPPPASPVVATAG